MSESLTSDETEPLAETLAGVPAPLFEPETEPLDQSPPAEAPADAPTTVEAFFVEGLAEPALPTEVEPLESAPARPADGSPNSLAFILEAMSALEHTLLRRMDGLQLTFDREVRAEATREKVVDRLHAELQEYKSDLLLGVLRPVFIDLIQLHDDIGKMMASAGEGESSRLVEMMSGVRQGIEDILYRQGVETYQDLDSDGFDPRRQRAYSTAPNDDPERAKRVAARLRKGFISGGKIIRPEIVSVYASPK